MSKVYVAQLSTRLDRSGPEPRRVPSRDVSDAARFGEIVHVLQPDGSPLLPDPISTVAALRAGLERFSADDYLIVGTGHPVVLAWATAIAAERAGGRIRVLHWDRGGERYVPVEAELFAQAA